jgi:DNA-binding NtrC family response regulator
MPPSKGTILIVEDDANQRGIVKTILDKDGFYVEDVATVREALDLVKDNHFDMVITDLRLPDGDGTEVLREIKQQNLPCHVVVMTAFGSIPSAIEATKLGAFHYLEKPFEKDQLLLVTNNAMNQVSLLRDNLMLKDQLFSKFHLDNIIGDHGKMHALFSLVKKVAPSSSTVLIYGESGTGKELFAKSIHYNSPRKSNPFFAINCAAIPENLLESELFGYEKGAFTGAVTRHAGLFEQANKSTLFLDEIGDLTIAMQAKILRALQEKEIRRIGGNETLKLDVRIIAATNKKLDEQLKKGLFREDLYYRLNVIAFTIPPLRERRTDIPILVEHFLRNLNGQEERKKAISADVLQVLIDYTWPGNVRQLESVIERAFIMCDEETILVDHLPDEVKQGESLVSSMKLKILADHLIDAKLTAAEYRLYLYLAESYGDSLELPEPKDVMERLGINRDTFFVGIGRLKELGLFDYRARRNQRRHGD